MGVPARAQTQFAMDWGSAIDTATGKEKNMFLLTWDKFNALAGCKEVVTTTHVTCEGNALRSYRGLPATLSGEFVAGKLIKFIIEAKGVGERASKAAYLAYVNDNRVLDSMFPLHFNPTDISFKSTHTLRNQWIASGQVRYSVSVQLDEQENTYDFTFVGERNGANPH
jgi:hypothetical protein